MTLLQIIVLAIVQGMTEFLPISSSGHLVLAPALLGWDDQGLAFDVAVHVGTLAAVVWYFRAELTRITVAFFTQWSPGADDARRMHARLAWFIVIGTIPVGLVGVLGKDFIETQLRSPAIIAATTAGFGVLLWLAARVGRKQRGVERMTFRDAVVIGLAQALALVPGTSRSGITMTAGFALNLTPEAAARFSFLLSIPVIVLAGGVTTLDLLNTPGAVDWQALVIGTVLSAVVAYLTITFFLRFIARIGMLPFMVYRLALAAVIVYLLVLPA